MTLERENVATADEPEWAPASLIGRQLEEAGFSITASGSERPRLRVRLGKDAPPLYVSVQAAREREESALEERAER
jgi:hypothetical protein